MQTIIRKSKKEDLKAVQELNHQLFIHDKDFDSSLNINWPLEKEGEEYFKNKINEKDGVCFVAELNNEIVGYLVGSIIEPCYYRNIKKISELENMIIKEDCRGKRIGEKLFKEFVEWSKLKKVERIKVSAYTSNESAIRFYKRIGFNFYATELEYNINI